MVARGLCDGQQTITFPRKLSDWRGAAESSAGRTAAEGASWLEGSGRVLEAVRN